MNPTNTNEIIAGRLVRLQAENVQNLTVVDIPLPEDGAVCVGGKNGAGKTSLLNCITIALGGAEEMPADPIRHGEESGKILLEFEGITVRLKLTTSKGVVHRALVVESKDGAKYPSPQALLDTLTGKLAFDPLEFSRREPKEQLAMLHKFLGLDFTTLAAERRKYYDERTVQGRLLDVVAAKLSSTLPYADAPASPVDVATINAELELALAANRKFEQAIDNLRAIDTSISAQSTRIDELKTALKMAETHLASLKKEREAQHAAAPSGKTDTSEIMKRLQSVQQTNAKVTANAAHASLKQERDDRAAKVKLLSDTIKAIDDKKAEAIARAEYPLAGMAVTDDEVTYEGTRFSQLNDATKIAISCAMGLSLNPKLKLMVIRQGCHLDDEMLGVVRDMAKQAGALILVERVGEGKECKIIIADGSVKEIRA